MIIKKNFINLYTIGPHSLRLLFDLQYLGIWNNLKNWLLNNKLPRKILDFGAGSSPWKRLFLKFAGNKKLKYLSLDLTGKHDFEKIEDLTKNDKFDLILLVEVLEHLEFPDLTIKELEKHLSLEGIIIITIPFNARIHPAPDDYWRWTEQGIRKMIKTNNLNIQQISYRGNNLASISSKINYLCLTGLIHWFWFPWALLALFLLAFPLLIITHITLFLNLYTKKPSDPLGLMAVITKAK